MGRSTCSISIAGKVSLGRDFSYGHLANPKIKELYEVVRNEDFDKGSEGWLLTGISYEFKKGKKYLFVNEFNKGMSFVYFVNESEFRAGGAYNESVFSDDLQDLKLFCKDMNIDLTEIESPATVQQTL